MQRFSPNCSSLAVNFLCPMKQTTPVHRALSPSKAVWDENAVLSRNQNVILKFLCSAGMKFSSNLYLIFSGREVGDFSLLKYILNLQIRIVLDILSQY